jgi:uncharacterized repeat protein (TIGR03803 family)
MKIRITRRQDASKTSEMTESVLGTKPVLALLTRLLWAAMVVLTVFGAQAGAVFTSLYSFTGTNDGANPQAGLVQGRDGYFYGTTAPENTSSGYGTVFKISGNGGLTTLYSFTGGDDGASPLASLVLGSDGNFYGTTYSGGIYTNGTVFKITSNGVMTSLYSFTGPNDGANPLAALMQARDGNFYGTTSGGGTTNYDSFTGNYGFGTVFKISTNGALTTLYTFGTWVTNEFGYGLDGAYPRAGLVQWSDGSLYGTTAIGGVNTEGSLFEISTNGALTLLYSFGGDNGSGVMPEAALVLGSDGSFYGTTANGPPYAGVFAGGRPDRHLVHLQPRIGGGQLLCLICIFRRQ